MENLTPRQIVEVLDRHIIGQAAAKRAVAVAIRNRWRRRQLDPALRKDVTPKNIIMIGPTGVGKTEIARRIANLTGAPFIKVEASKYTEVGYHGRDVESMIRDLLDHAIGMVQSEQSKLVAGKASAGATERLIDLLFPMPAVAIAPDAEAGDAPGAPGGDAPDDRRTRTRGKLREQLEAGVLEDKEVEMTLTRKPQVNVMFAGMGLDQMDPEMANVLDKLVPEQSKRRKMAVREARAVFIDEETDKLLDKDRIIADALERTQEDGIVFLDEIDKIASPSGNVRGGGGGPDVSRQGVQRDLLPIVEGSAVTTRHGVVQTDHILFIAAGAFHSASVSDLMPELQGRFPIRVELSPLTRDDFVRILTEPDHALTKQHQALLKVEGLDVVFEPGAVDAMADLAAQANATLENIGARRLVTIVERVFERINFEAPEMKAAGDTRVVIGEKLVRDQVETLLKDDDLNKYVL